VRKLNGHAFAIGALALCVGSCTYRPLPSVTCQKLRALEMGMSREQIVAILGPPADFGDSFMDYSSPRTGNTLGGITLTVHLKSGRLMRVSSDQRHILATSTPLVFYLDENERTEGKWFKQTYCPE